MAPTMKHVVRVLLTLLYLLNVDRCYSATNVSLTNVLDTLTKLVDYQRKSYQSLGLEGHFGLRVVEGQLKLLIAEYGKGKHRTIPAHLMTRIRQLAEEAMKVANMAIPHLHEHDPQRFVILRYEIQNPWVTFHPHRLINSSLVWDKNIKANEISEDLNLKCIAEATGTRNKEGIKCKFSDQCLQIMTERGHHGYSLLNQLFFTALAVRVNCNGQLNTFLQTKNSSLEILQAELCSNAYSDLTEKIKTYGIQMSFQDIFLKLEFICPNLGFVNFLRNDWLEYILSWQDSSGCFQRESNESDKDKLVDNTQSMGSDVQSPVYLGSVTFKPNNNVSPETMNIYGYAHKDSEHPAVVDYHKNYNQEGTNDEHVLIPKSNEHQEAYEQHPAIQQSGNQQMLLSDTYNNNVHNNGYHLNNFPEVNYHAISDSVAHDKKNAVIGADNTGNQYPTFQQQNYYPSYYNFPENKHQNNQLAFHEVAPLQHLYNSPVYHINKIQKNQPNHYYQPHQEKKPAAELYYNNNYNVHNPSDNIHYRNNLNLLHSEDHLNNHLSGDLGYNRQHEQGVHIDPSLYNLGLYDRINSYQHSPNQNQHSQNPSHSAKQEPYVQDYSQMANIHNFISADTEHKALPLQQGNGQEIVTNVVSPEHWHRIFKGSLVPDNQMKRKEIVNHMPNYINSPVHIQYDNNPKYDLSNSHQSMAAVLSQNIDRNKFSYSPVQPNQNIFSRPLINPNNHISADHEHSHVLLPVSAHEIDPQKELKDKDQPAFNNVLQQSPNNNQREPVNQFTSRSRLLNTGGIQTDVLLQPADYRSDLQKNSQQTGDQEKNPSNIGQHYDLPLRVLQPPLNYKQKTPKNVLNIVNKTLSNEKIVQLSPHILQNPEISRKADSSKNNNEHSSNSLVAPFNKLNMQNRYGNHKQWQYPVQKEVVRSKRNLLEIDENESEDDGYYFDRDRHLGQSSDIDSATQKVYMYYYPIYEQMKRMNKAKERQMIKKSKNTSRKLLRQKEIKGICSTEVSGMAATALVMYVRYLVDPGPAEFQHLRLDKPNGDNFNSSVNVYKAKITNNNNALVHHFSDNALKLSPVIQHFQSLQNSRLRSNKYKPLYIGDLRRLLHPEESDDYVRKAETYKDLVDNVFVPPSGKQKVLEKPQVKDQLQIVKKEVSGVVQTIEEKSRTIEYPDAVYVGNNNNENNNAMGSHIAYLQHHLQTELGYHLIIIVIVSLACIFILYRYFRYRRFLSRHRTKSI